MIAEFRNGKVIAGIHSVSKSLLGISTNFHITVRKLVLMINLPHFHKGIPAEFISERVAEAVDIF